MSKLFPEEVALAERLQDEWHGAIGRVVDQFMRTVTRKGQERDTGSLVWERVEFPGGFLTILRQKLERLVPLFACYDPLDVGSMNWEKAREECVDFGAYAFFMAAIIDMIQRRMMQGAGGIEGEVIYGSMDKTRRTARRELYYNRFIQGSPWVTEPTWKRMQRAEEKTGDDQSISSPPEE
jgi:hypothetical protein